MRFESNGVAPDGDIALDDLGHFESDCNSESEPNVIYECWFETENSCEYSTSTNAPGFEFQRARNGYIEEDHTTHTKEGHYMFLDGSLGSLEIGQTTRNATLSLPSLSIDTPHCILFYFQLKGSVKLTMEVSYEVEDEGHTIDTFEVVGNESSRYFDRWLQGHMDANKPNMNKMQILFRGEVETIELETSPYLALDDVLIIKGVCPTLSCNFEQVQDVDACGWENDLQFEDFVNWEIVEGPGSNFPETGPPDGHNKGNSFSRRLPVIHAKLK